MTNSKIDLETFKTWMDHPVTKEVMKSLANLRDGLNESLYSEEIIMGPHDTAARILGQREGVETLLNIHAEDVVNDEESHR